METIDAFATAYPLDILIADEHPSGLEETQQLLSGLGYCPKMAGSRADLLQMAASQEYDVILMDTAIPGLEQVVDLLSPGPDILPLIIGVSRDARPDFKEVCVKALMDDCITRPLEPADLLLQLKACSVLAGKCQIRRF